MRAWSESNTLISRQVWPRFTRESNSRRHQMRKFLIGLIVIAGAMAITITEADARRLGGGGSFGRQSQGPPRQQAPAQPSQATRSAAPPAAAPAPLGVPPKPASTWRGMLGGALLGFGLGALLSHFGMGGAMASMISTILMVGLLAFAAMVIYRMLRRKQDVAVAKPAFAGPAASYTPEIGSRIEPRNEPWQPAALQSAQPAASSHVMPQTPWGVPSDFDTTGFLRHAKTYFIRLQAAWDKADVGDIREFTTPQMFAELKMLIQERGASPNMTDVVTLDAQLLGMETHADE